MISEQVAGQLLSQGTLGLAVLVLGTVIVYLYKDNQKLRDKYDQLQEKRYIESQDDREKLMEPLKEQSKMTEKIYEMMLSRRNP